MPARPKPTTAQAVLWLAVCGGLFCAGYGIANMLAVQQGPAPSIRFDWEQRIPFLPWTIFPYWSFDLFYPLAFFICADADELQRHVRRVLTAQLVAVICFVAFPLQLATTKPPTDGLPGLLFAALGGMDRPYNTAPSLHIALLVILWDLYARHVLRRFHLALHASALLIGVSVLTTWQHHVFDLVAGTALGLLCLWLWPNADARMPYVTAAPRSPILRTSGRRLCADARLNFLRFSYRVFFYALATAPVWGVLLAFAIIWQRLPV